MGIVVDLVVGLLLLGMTYALMSEGLWGAALMFFNALFAAMVTLNFYEPLAQAIGTNVGFLSGFADTLCILVIFSVTLLIMRLLTERFAPAMVRFPTPVYHVGRVLFGFAGSAVTMGILLIALDASPGQKRIFGMFDYKYRPFYGTRFDKEVLAFFQHSTGYIFTRSGPPDPYREFGNVRAFDPKGDWLLRAQTARPHGTGEVLGGDEAKADDAGGAEGQPAGGAPAGQAGPGIPGGTAGAAAGLAPTN